MKRRLLLRRLLSVLVLTLLATGVAWIGLSAGFLLGFQHRATDALFPAAPYDKQVVVVGLDSATVKFLDGYGGKRGPMAQLVNQLDAAGAAVIVFDVVFSGPSDDDPAGDAAFAEAIARSGNVVLAETAEPRDTESGPPVAKKASLNGPYEAFADGAAAVGHAQVSPSPDDGVVRSLPLVFDIDGDFVPALSMAAFMVARGGSAPPIVRDDGVQAGDRFIPADSTTNMVVNWTTKLSDPPEEISALDVLNGTMDPAKLKDKIVLIGAHAADGRHPTGADRLVEPHVRGASSTPTPLNTMLNAAYLDAVVGCLDARLGRPPHGARRTRRAHAAVLARPRSSPCSWVPATSCSCSSASTTGSMHDLVYPLARDGRRRSSPPWASSTSARRASAAG